jgi:carboxyl-terminal processing protease
MNVKRKFGWKIISILLALIIGFILGNFISGKAIGKKLFFSNENKINVILDIINEDYVDPISMKDLTEDAITHILGELDPHSVYISRQDLQLFNEDMDGYFGGIGADCIIRMDTIVIMRVLPGSPAEQAGLSQGDRIVTINDSLFTGVSLLDETLQTTLRGKVNTPVKLEIKRSSSDQLIPFEIMRSDIPLSTVKTAYEIEKGIGLIKIYDKFSHTTYKEFINALAKLSSMGCRAFIIDLRMNGGGAMDAAVNIANEFLQAGQMIVYTEGKAFPRQEAWANGTGTFQESPIIVLMDQLSASASEIIAGAIQDNDRGLIIGRRSFGKGLVQNQIELSDQSALRLTIARYYTPSGRNIQRKYELGKTDEYNQEWLNQLANGEGFYADSIKLDKSLAYKTVHGRTVYGGGGIMPDIFVPIDTAELTTYYIKLKDKDIFNQFAFEYTENNKTRLSRFKNYQEMLEYLKTQPILNEVVYYAEKAGIKRRSNLITRSANQILMASYACIVRNFFGEEAFFPVLMQHDPVIKQAVEAIRKGHATKEAIQEEKYRPLKGNK